MHVAQTTTLRDARAQYFHANGLGEDGGYSKRWVKLRIGPLPIWFPNTAARRRAVWLHDLHHIVTDYDTSWVGEAEIAAWELASGCRDYFAAWLLNAAAMAIGIMIAPRRVWRAFKRGRIGTNLYHLNVDERWLEETVGAVRQRISLSKQNA